MKLAISNIAWDRAEDTDICRVLQRYGVTGVEIAPTKVWPNPLDVSDAEVDAYARFWRSQSVGVSSMQALLFGRPDLAIFGAPEKREETLAYLEGIIRLGGLLGAGALVFGSPGNRHTGSLERDQVEAIAIEFFRSVGRIALEHNTIFCIEPNPTEYGCDFITTSAEGRDLVAKVDHPGFGLHLDAAGMTLSQENLDAELTMSIGKLCHFHVSEPNLQPIGSGGVDHALFSKKLKAANYKRWVSVEMRATGNAGNVTGVENALKVVCDYYL